MVLSMGQRCFESWPKCDRNLCCCQWQDVVVMGFQNKMQIENLFQSVQAVGIIFFLLIFYSWGCLLWQYHLLYPFRANSQNGQDFFEGTVRHMPPTRPALLWPNHKIQADLLMGTVSLLHSPEIRAQQVPSCRGHPTDVSVDKCFSPKGKETATVILTRCQLKAGSWQEIWGQEGEGNHLETYLFFDNKGFLDSSGEPKVYYLST